MNIELPLALSFIESELKDLLIEVNKIRRIRNDIVHQGLDITAEKTKGAIDTIYSFVNYIETKT
jgi:hypothetical protein